MKSSSDVHALTGPVRPAGRALDLLAVRDDDAAVVLVGGAVGADQLPRHRRRDVDQRENGAERGEPQAQRRTNNLIRRHDCYLL
jgi:hypothetical protein